MDIADALSNSLLSAQDERLIAILFDRPIAFHRPFVRIGGSVSSALMLSQAVYWSKRTADPEGWFYKTAKEWEEETGLTRREQETARKALADVLTTELRGVPATLFFRVNFVNLFPLLLKSAKTSLAESANLGWRKAPNLMREDRETALIRAETIPKTTKKPMEMPGIPLLLQTPGFQTAWTDWLAYRKEAKKPVTPLSAAKQLAMLEALGPDRAILSINASIQNQWQGLFEPRDQRNATTLPPRPNGRYFEQAGSYAGITDK